jgi:RHS repeat-associated protein
MNNKPLDDANNSKNQNNDQSRALFTSSIANQEQHKIPEISLPKGGGAIKGIDEKFEVNPVNGTNSVSIPLPVSPSRGGFAPNLSISYGSGQGNGLFGMGWGLNLPSIQRKTDKQLPKYQDATESDTFILAGAEDLIPLLEETALGSGVWNEVIRITTTHQVKKYRPRIEGSWIRIEQWKELTTGIIHWRVISTNNTVTFYGLTANARIANPEAPDTQIFEWLISHSYDNVGNIILYDYKEENLAGVSPSIYEKNRSISNVTNRYLKRVHYGNRKHYNQGDPLPDPSGFLFETVLDYGEHDVIPTPQEVHTWEARPDAFSSFRSGFEVRTYRFCKRVLLFHKFDNPIDHPNQYDQPVVDYLVAAVEFGYEDFPDKNASAQHLEGFTYLKKVLSKGYLYNTATAAYKVKEQAPLCYYYQQHEWNTKTQTLSEEALKQAPTGINNSGYTWTDLYSEGLSGILTEQNQAWYYKQNLGGGNFSPATLLKEKPSFWGLNAGVLQLQDLDGSGEKQLVNWANVPKGYFQFEEGEEWKGLQLFESVPNRNLQKDPNARFIDLDGDGRPDLLITEDNLFQWYESKGKKGFGKMNQVLMPWDEEEGPRIVFADQEQSIFLADMTGDGMTDILRIKNGSICFWANKGYGQFSAKISMENAPRFDHEELFNPQYLKLVDMDGSGTSDICYLRKDSIQIWMNHSGNTWSAAPTIINPFPTIDNQVNVDFVDLLGTGTTCIVWSSPAAKDQQTPLRYINLTNSIKPHLLYRYKNNMGKEVSFKYLPSTHFYLEDKKAGQPWATQLPFPVHLVHKTQVKDLIRNTVFISKYSYHHGFYDRAEREFRGFGRVEQLDTEDFNLLDLEASNTPSNPAHYQVPIKSVSWFHTGASFKHQKLTDAYQNEYYKNPSVEQELGGIELPENLDDQAYHEAFRACKGLLLRQEVYSLDLDHPDGLHVHPYNVAESAYQVQLVQPHKGQRYASFMVVPVQSLTYAYERNPADPRISHNLVLAINKLGIPTETAAVIYPRLAIPTGSTFPWMVREAQQKLHVVYSNISLTNDVDTDDAYRIQTAYEEQIFEVLGLTWTASDFFFSIDNMKSAILHAADIPYEQDASGVAIPYLPDYIGMAVEKRLSGHAKSLFLKDDLSGALNEGELESLGIPYKSYQLAYTKGLRDKLYKTSPGASTSLLTTLGGTVLMDANYESDADGNWWVPSGTTIFPTNAASNFYLPNKIEDALGIVSLVTYDRYKLLMTSSEDALENIVTVENDYRVLAPKLITDPNGNRSAVEFDELGVVVRSAVMGKVGVNDGDMLQGIETATAEISYDYLNWMLHGKPNFVYSKVREEHHSTGLAVVWQESYVYSDGSGGAIMTKVQTKDGWANSWSNGVLTQVDTNTLPTKRWIGNGRTIIDNKGNPIKQYEPYFSDTHEYEEEDDLVQAGVTPILYYDAAGRNIKTVLPNDTFVKVEFDAWQSREYDTNDTVLESKWYTDLYEANPLNLAIPPNEVILDSLTEPTGTLVTPELRAAWLASQHANTPNITHTDCLGRSIYAETKEFDTATAVRHAVYTETDLSGRFSKTYDQIATNQLLIAGNYNIARNVSAFGLTNMLGQGVYNQTAVKSKAWVFTDVIGRMLRVWDNPDAANTQDRITFRTEYDDLHRPLKTFVQRGNIPASEICFAKTVYGESLPSVYPSIWTMTDVLAANLRGQAYKSFDQSGVLTTEQLDFKGNPLRVTRQLVSDYHINIDWNGSPSREIDIFETSATYDALNRPKETILPDGSVVIPTYNIGGYLENLEVDALGLGNPVDFMKGQDFDAKGQRESIKYGNDTISKFFYDANTFRLTNLLTTDSSNAKLQDLQYTYDPVGNITEVEDLAQQIFYFQNAVINPIKKYNYDALYRLKKANGREHAGSTVRPPHEDLAHLAGIPSQNSANAVREYTQNYEYDAAGNILEMKHRTSGAGATGSWTRNYDYNTSADNQLLNTSITTSGGTNTYNYSNYDAHGNMTSMPHLQAMTWDFQDQLRVVELSGGKAYYNYDESGQRVRKVIERNGSKKSERLYLGGVERYQEYNNNGAVTLERWSLQVEDIAQVDTLTIDNSITVVTPISLIRYQYRDHLGSASMETNETGQVISYEEYHPFGTSAYRVAKSGTDLSLKRYRFTGKERDDETGLYYFGVRYYAAWLGRWTSSDPGDFVDGLNLYVYVRNNPVMLVDEEGYAGEPPPDDLMNGEEAEEVKPEGSTWESVHKWSDKVTDSDLQKAYGTEVIERGMKYTTLFGFKIGTGVPYTKQEWEDHRCETYENLYNNTIRNYYNEYRQEGDDLQMDCFDYALYGLINFANDYELPVAFGSYDKDKQDLGIVTNSDQFGNGDWKGLYTFLALPGGLNLGSKEAWKFADHSDWKGAFTKMKMETDSKEYSKVESGDLHLFNHHTWVVMTTFEQGGERKLQVMGGNQHGGLTKTPLESRTYSWQTIQNNLNSQGHKDPSVFATWHFENFDKQK